MTYFDIKNKCVKWIKDYFDTTTNNGNAIIGISGGKDSSIAAALCVEALGKDRVLGVLMPQGEQKDIYDAIALVKFLDIKYCVINIEEPVNAILNSLPFDVSNQTRINLPPRIRMSTLYAVAQSNNGRVVNTCNLSEDYVGYSTLYGDNVGDFSPCSRLTVTDMLEIGHILGLPTFLVNKTPSDGLSGQTDEKRLGFSYKELDKYITSGKINNLNHKKLIDDKHKWNKFKLEPMPFFDPHIERSLDINV